MSILRTPMVPNVNRTWRNSARVLRPILMVLTRRDWSGEMSIPADSGAIIALNHLSQIDPILTTHFVWEHHGRAPSFVAKQSLFENRYVGWWFRGTDHVAVDRESGGDAIGPAIEAVTNGKVVLFYVEGSITRDPDGWPMTPKTGAARVALASGIPVIPVAQWGAQNLMPAYSGKLNLRRRTNVAYRAGKPVDLTDLIGKQDDPVAVHEATERIMRAIVAELEVIRGEAAPAERFDAAAHGVSRYGRYK